MGLFKKLFGGSSMDAEQTNEDGKKKKDFEVLKYDGIRALKQGQLAYSIQCFTSALERKEDLEVRDYLSQAYVHNNELLPAYEQLEKLAVAQPDNKLIWTRMAEVAYMMEDYTKMMLACQKGLAIDKDDARLLYLQAESFVGQGNLIAAIAVLTQAITVGEESNEEAQARLLRGETLLKMGDINSADEDAQWLLEQIGHPVEEVFLLKARIAHAKGNKEESISYYNKVIDTNPFSAIAFRERGAVYLEMGDKVNAERDMQSFLEVNPQEAEAVNGEFQAEGTEGECSTHASAKLGEEGQNIQQKIEKIYKDSLANPYGL